MASYLLVVLLILISGVTSQRFRIKVANNKTPLKRWGYKTKICSITFKDMRTNVDHNRSLPMIYFVTSTYPRPEQIPELVRLSHTLMHVPRITWILADNKAQCSQRVSRLLHSTGLPFTHIATSKPKKSSGAWVARNDIHGLSSRRAAVRWIRKSKSNGTLYFGDDDNTYDLDLFKEIRKTKMISMFPVGFVGFDGVVAPLLRNGKVKAFLNSWPAFGKLPVDISGFAINTTHLWKTYISVLMPSTPGAMADKFVSLDGFDIDDIETLADNCTKILVWHMQTVNNPVRQLQVNLNSVAGSKYENLQPLLRGLSDENVIRISPKLGHSGNIVVNGQTVDNLANF